jgi:uncharacterized protein YbgA (DUF1722 family)/uncharacterized protein YbbK (DUF523 family)
MPASRFARPRVLVSKCLGFDSCRYDGSIIKDPYLPNLARHVQVTTVCPEVEIGLGTPRETLRLVRLEGSDRLLQPATGRDLTGKMQRFTRAFLAKAAEPDGIIMKGRSPSCGLTDARIYGPGDRAPALERGAGLFGRAVRDRFPGIPVVDEGRLKNFTLREHFFTALFTFATFRTLKARPTMGKLVAFHSDHKMLLMAHSEKHLRIMGRLVANPDRRPLPKVIEGYEEHLRRALARAARFTSNINVLMHALGYFSRGLGAREKAHFLDLLEQYRSGAVPLSVPVGLLRSLVIRFEEAYLERQTFLEPFPRDLVEITDSGKGRNR